MPLRYEIVDVFTSMPYTGNPLAVVFGAEDIPGERMQAIAREFNLSETTFVLPVTDPDASYRVRIFTPGAELPFAGHPSIGTALTLARHGGLAEGAHLQECGAGLMPITIEGDRAVLTGGTPSPLVELDPVPYLAAAGLTENDLDGVPYRTGAGFDHEYLPVKADAVARAASRPREDVPKVYLFSWNAEAHHAHARLFAPGIGVAEDPATGSAALGLGAYLVGTGLLPGDGTSAFTIGQGDLIARPSVLECTVTASGGTATTVTVAGGAVLVARGELV